VVEAHARRSVVRLVPHQRSKERQGMKRRSRNRAVWLGWSAAALALFFIAFSWKQRDRDSHVRPDEDLVADSSGVQGTPRRNAALFAPKLKVSLSGTVTTAGQPLANASVCASCVGCDLSSPASAPTCTKSATDGRYAFANQLSGDVLVSASAEDHAPGFANLGKPIATSALEADAIHEYDIDLAKGGARVDGAVVDTMGGPVAGATVQVLFKIDGSITAPAALQAATTDSDGQFALWCLPGLVRLIARADGYAPGYATRSAPTSGLELIVTPAASIRGTVETQQGQPIANARVQAVMSMEPPEQATSDAEGRFTIPGLKPGVYQLRATAERWLGELPSTLTVDLGEVIDDVVIQVRRSAAVRGKIVVGETGACSDGQAMLAPRAGDSSVPILTATANLQGAVLFDAVPPGNYQVTLACSGYEPQPATPLEVGQSDISGLVWKFEQHRSIQGRVVDQGGRPLPKLQLQVRDVRNTDGHSGYTLGDADGKFWFRGVPPGVYAVEAQQVGISREVDVSRGDVTDLTIIADAIGRLAVHVTTPQGEPRDGLTVSAIAGADGRQPLPPEEQGDGMYVFGSIAAGTYSVHVNDGVNPQLRAGAPTGEIKVVAGQVTRLELKFGGHTGRITGRVVDDTGRQVANVWVRAKPGASPDIGAQMQEYRVIDESRRSLSDEDGAFTLEGLAEDGSFVVLAERPLGGQAQASGVKAGATIELRLEALGSLGGLAVGPNGQQPIENFRISISNERTGQERSEVFYDRAGHWRIDDVTPGPVQITAIDHDRNVAMLTQELQPKQRLDSLRLELRPDMPPLAAGGGPTKQADVE
jgi:protocatechuate 3,4-dioxygenase beta subunit